MELAHPTLHYGDTWDDLDEPLVVLSELEPFPTKGIEFTSIFRPGTHRNTFKRTRQLFKDGMIPALAQAFGITPALLPVCFHRWHKFAYEYLRFRMMHDDHRYNWPVIIYCDNETMFLCFCPDRAATPSLSVSGTL
jgi:hypothetical protein